MDNEAPMPFRRPRFDWSFNFGHVMQVVTMTVTMFGFVWYTAQVTTEIRHSIGTLQDQTVKLIPVVESLARSQDVQDVKLHNLSEAVREVKGSEADIRAKIGTMREDITGIKARIGTGRIAD